ncbi:MAG: hypothetical protein ACRDG4_08095, partial [Chloroflexota bacterium]
IMNDIVIRFVAPDWKPQAYNAGRPLSGLANSGRITFVIPVQEGRLARRLKTTIGGVRIAVLTPNFNQRIIEGYVVSWRARHTASTRRTGA